jgi:hypothetical protein
MRGGGGQRQHGCEQAGEQSIHLQKASLDQRRLAAASASRLRAIMPHAPASSKPRAAAQLIDVFPLSGMSKM